MIKLGILGVAALTAATIGTTPEIVELVIVSHEGSLSWQN